MCDTRQLLLSSFVPVSVDGAAYCREGAFWSQSVNIAADSECPYSIWVRAAKTAETPIHLTQLTAMPMQVRHHIPEPSDQTVRNLWWHR
ncbi:hypothetical protein K466DRAFT_88191 [Polyporus arcularius HHB13444]|uniref:Uncharacterized protein n=1 Tax=Polyporus arcularius HHB13444 TaxID=1314778 RepID=A0A5C3PEN4_9APHY|nr:hypothetical protein K466DRAFT_88191 [Polyporus arcularius HHB13444]